MKGDSHVVLRDSGILCLTIQRLSNFAYETHDQVKDMRLLKINVSFVLPVAVDSSSKLHDKMEFLP